MKHLITLLIILSTGFGYSQQYLYNANDIAIATYEFELTHMDSISKYTADTLITAVVRFNQSGALRNVSYFRGTFIGYYDFGSEGGPTNIVSVWPGLDAFIKSQYKFFPDSHYDKEQGRVNVLTFQLHFNKAVLPKAIALQKRQKEEEKRIITQMNAENPLIDVLPNAGFTLNIKKLIIDDVKQPLQQITGSLNYLDSGAVRLSPDCYLTFKVLKTSENGSPANYLEYKLFVLRDGQATLYLKENRFTIADGVARLVAVGYSDYTADEEGVDSVDYKPGENNEAGLIISNDSFDFEIDITFTQP